MATIKNTISLQDRMTPVFNRITQSMARTTTQMERVNRTATRGIPTTVFRNVTSSVNQANGGINNFNNNLRNTERNSERVNSSMQKIPKNIGMMALGLNAVIALVGKLINLLKQPIQLFDKMSQLESRANMVNDGLQTTAQLQDKILESANRSRASYQDTADAVTKLNMLAANQFKTNEEAISFVETLNKMFVISGTGAQEASAAMYQLTQAMAAGKLQGDEFRSILENAPMLAQAIAKEMNISMDQLKKMSSDGKITADIIKNAMITATDSVNERFESMPKTFGQHMQILKNKAVDALEPVAAKFSELLNTPGADSFFNGLTSTLTSLGNIAYYVFNAMVQGCVWIKERLATLKPYFDVISLVLSVMGHVGAFAFDLIVQGVDWLLQALEFLYPVIMGVGGAILSYLLASWVLTFIGFMTRIPVLVAGLWSMVAPIIAQAIAWLAVNWPILLVFIAIGLLIAIMASLGVTVSDVVGFIVGIFYGLWAFLQNICIAIYNMFAPLATFLGNLFIDPIGAIKMLFLDMAEYVVNKIAWVAKALEGLVNLIPGVEINITAGLDSMLEQIQGAKDKVKADHNVEETQFKEYKDLGAEFNKGFDKGSGFMDGLSGFGNLGDIFNSPDKPYTSGIGDSFGMGGMDNTLNGGKLDEVGKIKDDVKITEEDIKLLKDISKAEFINKYTTLRPEMKVEFTGPVTETADVNKIMAAIEDMTEQALSNVIVEEVF